MQLNGTAETMQQQHDWEIVMMVDLMIGEHSYNSEPHQQMQTRQPEHQSKGKDIISCTTQGILGGIHIFQDILGNTYIFQGVAN